MFSWQWDGVCSVHDGILRLVVSLWKWLLNDGTIQRSVFHKDRLDNIYIFIVLLTYYKWNWKKLKHFLTESWKMSLYLFLGPCLSDFSSLHNIFELLIWYGVQIAMSAHKRTWAAQRSPHIVRQTGTAGYCKHDNIFFSLYYIMLMMEV